jgi:hypothetical protein
MIAQFRQKGSYNDSLVWWEAQNQDLIPSTTYIGHVDLMTNEISIGRVDLMRMGTTYISEFQKKM